MDKSIHIQCLHKYVFYFFFLTEEMQEWREFLDPNYKFKSIVFRYSIIFNNFSTLLKYSVGFIIIFTFIPLFILAILVFLSFLSTTVMAWCCLIIEVSFATTLTIVGSITFNTLLKYNNNKYDFNKQAKLLVLCATVNISAISIWTIVGTDPFFLALSICWALVTIPFVDWICNILYPIYLLKEKENKIKINATGDTIGDANGNINRIYGKTNALVKIVCDPIGFETFMNHLRSEFAAENLLFVVYLIQFQNFLIQFSKKQGKELLFDGNDEWKPFIIKDWKLPDNVPQSAIFEMHDRASNAQNKNKNKNKNEKKNVMFRVVDVIYRKFVEKQRAILEVNISGRNRAQIAHFHSKMINEQLEYCDYDDIGKIKDIWLSLRVAGLECWQLMSHTLARYQLPDSLA